MYDELFDACKGDIERLQACISEEPLDLLHIYKEGLDGCHAFQT